ncbi:MAG: pilus assembly PilX N-terminal domain-containing protein [Sedimentisphaerales bacterium]|nr:pilus assembly PilX N-terminal domain-containing protein [Sedimentisphaerales bacterium]
MKRKRTSSKRHKGAALIIAMVFVLLFASLAVSLVSLTGTNAQIASNQHKIGLARSSAHSGLEVGRYLLSQVYMPGYTMPADRFKKTADYLDGLSGANVTLDYNGVDVIGVSFPLTTIDTASGQSFSAYLQPTANVDIMQLDVTGKGESFQKKIRVQYKFGTRAHSVFDYGVATRGPLNLSGNIQLEGYNISVESDVYIESLDYDEALSIIGNSQIAGDVKIVNPDAYVTLQGGQAGIGGETGQDAIDNHVDVGVAPTEFPLPLPNYFFQYVEGDYDPNNSVHVNVRIPPNTNPSFSAGTEFMGVLFVEVPNVVEFSGHVTITGIIVGNGDVLDNSGTNQLNFLGTVDSYPVTNLPDTSQFSELRNETGTFLMAPGFAASFGGNFETLNGAIAANGIEFFGNAGGIINGSVVNYSDTPMTLSGNSDLQFNRTGLTEVPAGFGPEIIIHYIPESYEEVIDG